MNVKFKIMLREKLIIVCDYVVNCGILAIVFFVPLIIDFSMLTFNAIDIYKVVMFRAFLSLLFLAYLAKIFLAGKFSYRGGKIIFLLAGLLFLSFFASSLLSIHPNQSLWGSYLRQQGFYNYVHYLIFFVLIVLNTKNFQQISRIIIAMVVSASLTAVYGIMQYFYLDPVVWTESVLTTGRIFSTLGQPNFFGHFLILVLPLSFYGLIILAKSFWARFFSGLAIALQLFCLIFTYSRAAWLGFAAALGFLVLARLAHQGRKKTALALAAALVIAVFTAIGLIALKPARQNHLYDMNLFNRLSSTVDLDGGSNKMRLFYLESALQEIKRASHLRKLVGFGPETLASVFIKYYRPAWGVYEAINSLPDRAHNWPFDQLLSLGMLGVLANLCFYAYLIYKAAKVLRRRQKWEPGDWLLIFLSASLAAYFVNNLFSFSLFTNFVYLFLILALTWLAINYRETEREARINLSAAARLIIWPAFLSAAAVLIYTNNIKQVQAEIYYARALRAMKQNDCGGAVNDMERVISLNPNNNFYQENYLFLALNCLPLIGNKMARADLRHNMESQITSVKDWDFFSLKENLARAYSLFGYYFDKSYYDGAENIFNGLIFEYPYLTAPYEDLGRQKMWQGDYPAAVKIFERALSILPPANHPALNGDHRRQIEAVEIRLLELAGQAAARLKNYSLADDYYRKALRLDPYRVTLYKNLADSYYLRGQLEPAISFNKRGLMLSPSDYHWPLSLSLLYRDKEDLAKARLYLAQALKLAPRNEELLKYEKELNK